MANKGCRSIILLQETETFDVVLHSAMSLGMNLFLLLSNTYMFTFVTCPESNPNFKLQKDYRFEL
jgi:hypothetical protein